MPPVADTLGWVSAIGGAIGGVAAVAALWGVFRRFRLDLNARVDERRQGIRLDVKNTGRAEGVVSEVVVLDGGAVEQAALFAGLEGERFKPATLPARSSWWLILQADKARGPFADDARVLVTYGHGKRRTLEPEWVEGVSYYGERLKSNWP